MSTSRKLLGLLVFVLILAGCDKIQEPSVNRAADAANERDTYMTRVVWFPATYSEDGDVELEKLLQKVNDWLEQNEEKISSHSTDVVNATQQIDDWAGIDSRVVIPSGILITYTVKQER